MLQEDIKHLTDVADVGMDSFKFSIAWTRMFPSKSKRLLNLYDVVDRVNTYLTFYEMSNDIVDGAGKVNQKAVDHYDDVIDRLIVEGMNPNQSVLCRTQNFSL